MVYNIELIHRYNTPKCIYVHVICILVIFSGPEEIGSDGKIVKEFEQK